MEWWEFLLVMAITLPIVVLWLGCIIDVISRPDISGWAKGGWMLFIIFLPLIGALVYAITRPKTILDRKAMEMNDSWDSDVPQVRDPEVRDQAPSVTDQNYGVR
jgi:hypothetical protein